jgi:hypothetical protein
VTCNDYSLSHDGLEVALTIVGRFPAKHRAVMCAGCRAGLTDIGLDIHIERRADPDRPDRGSFSLGPLLRRLAAA